MARAVLRAAGSTVGDALHRPHLTLAAASVAEDRTGRVIDVARAVAMRHAGPDVQLDLVGRFEEAGVVWVGPACASQSVLELQTDADSALCEDGWPRAFGEHTTPAGWVGHCTVATGLHGRALDRAQESLRERWRPITARGVALVVLQVGARGDVAAFPLG